MMDTNRHWSGRWIKGISQGPLETNKSSPAPYLRKCFDVKKIPSDAEAFACGLGWHEFLINGRKPDERVLTPVVTQFDKHVSYVVYNITSFIRVGKNVVTVILGNGWYNCQTEDVWDFTHAPWRDYPKLLCEIEVDGKVLLKSDNTWKTHSSPIVFDALRNGEVYDARLEIPGLFDPGFDDSTWEHASYINPPGGVLAKEELEPCRVQNRYDPVAVHEITPTQFTYDFGVNLTGWCEIEVVGPAGADVMLQYSESLRDNMDIDREYIGMFIKTSEFQTDRYWLRGGGVETWHPRFTYHGFRYVKVSSSNPDVKIKRIEAHFIHNHFSFCGTFTSSSPTLNRLQEMTRQAFLSNYTGIPTDCPHREKNGWTGDAQLALETGLWNFDIKLAASHFEQILVDTQRPTGQLPGIAPTGGWGFNWGSGPAWDIYLFEAPWQIFLFTGDCALMHKHYGAMEKYINYCQSMSTDHLVDFGLGDWAHPDRNRMATPEMTSSAYYYYAVTQISKFSRILGHNATHYQSLASCIRDSINRKYYNTDGTYANRAWSAAGAALYFGIEEEAERSKIVARLVEDIRKNKHRADFGILGAKYIPRVLADCGFADDALKLITQPEYPGWGYWVQQNATSLWESWRGDSSRNHIMFGDISAWMYQYLGGIRPMVNHPGFEQFVLQPLFPQDLQCASATHQSRFGEIKSSWHRQNDGIICQFKVPGNSIAHIRIPGHEQELHPGEHEILLTS